MTVRSKILLLWWKNAVQYFFQIDVCKKICVGMHNVVRSRGVYSVGWVFLVHRVFRYFCGKSFSYFATYRRTQRWRHGISDLAMLVEDATVEAIRVRESLRSGALSHAYQASLIGVKNSSLKSNHLFNLSNIMFCDVQSRMLYIYTPSQNFDSFRIRDITKICCEKNVKNNDFA